MAPPGLTRSTASSSEPCVPAASTTTPYSSPRRAPAPSELARWRAGAGGAPRGRRRDRSPAPRRPRQDRSTRRRSRGRGHRARPRPGRTARMPTASGSTSAPDRRVDPCRQGHDGSAGRRSPRQPGHRRATRRAAGRHRSGTGWSRRRGTDRSCRTTRWVAPRPACRRRAHRRIRGPASPAGSTPRGAGRTRRCRTNARARAPGRSRAPGAVTSTSTTATPPSPDARTARTPGVLQARGREARAPTPLRCGRSSNGLGVERRWRISVSTAGWRSSPARAVASGREHALLLAGRGAWWSSTTWAARSTAPAATPAPASRSSTRSRPPAAKPCSTPTRWRRPRAVRPSCRPRSTASGASTSW